MAWWVLACMAVPFVPSPYIAFSTQSPSPPPLLPAGGMLGSGACVALFGAAYFWNIHSMTYFITVQVAGGGWTAGGGLQGGGGLGAAMCIGGWMCAWLSCDA